MWVAAAVLRAAAAESTSSHPAPVAPAVAVAAPASKPAPDAKPAAVEEGQTEMAFDADGGHLPDDPPALAPMKPAGPFEAIPTEAHPAPEMTSEARGLVTLGRSLTERGDLAGAEIAFMQVLNSKAGRPEKCDALVGLGRMFRKRGDLTKAAATFEKFLKEFPGDDQSPAVYLELGRTLRDMGSDRLAIARFYSVINSTLKLPADGFETYRQLAKTAQFEIAETYFRAGDFAEASRFFSRLKLLDLAPADRARAHFKSVYSLYLSGDYAATVTGLRAYLEQNPEDENVPEARYLLSVCLFRLNRLPEACEVTLALLKEERARTGHDIARWTYWQRKTGNQLANEFYEQGDLTSALSIYRGLAELADTPIWRLPVLYQIGLCQERLRQPELARETYQSVLDNAKPPKPEDTLPPHLQDLVRMAAWRRDHLEWEQTTEAHLDQFFKTIPTSAGGSADSPRHESPGGIAAAPKALR